ncbi:MAG: site-2 protease family protein [Clostridia bacterium]|nr:site-2 protease family protein [Clostridia bacterium]
MFLNQFTNPEYWLNLLYSLPAVLIALSFHEYAHAWAANWCGDATARSRGRMSLDPLKHLDPVGTICLLLFHFGWAKPVPVNPRNYRHPRRDDVIVSLAGIIMNFIVAFVAYGIYYITVYVAGWDNMIFVRIMTPIILLNITLGIFNLIPIPPLDGFHVLSAIAPRPMHKFGAAVGRYGMIILLVLLATGAISWLLNGVTSGVLMLYDGFWRLVA